MKTEVTLERPFMGHFIEQRSKSKMFNVTGFVKIANIKRMELGKPTFNLSQFLNSASTKEFIEELQKTEERVVIKSRGRNSKTWVHPLLFIDLALSIDSKFKVEVYKWLYDELLQHRNNSGDSYNKMAGTLFNKFGDKHLFPKYITKVAIYIKENCQVSDWNKATQNQLHLRNKMQENITLLCSALKNTNEAVRIGVKKALEDNRNLISK